MYIWRCRCIVQLLFRNTHSPLKKITFDCHILLDMVMVYQQMTKILRVQWKKSNKNHDNLQNVALS